MECASGAGFHVAASTEMPLRTAAIPGWPQFRAPAVCFSNSASSAARPPDRPLPRPATPAARRRATLPRDAFFRFTAIVDHLTCHLPGLQEAPYPWSRIRVPMVITQARPVATTDTVPGLFFAQASRRGRHVALRRKRFGIWHRITWEEYAAQVRLVANALLALGVQRGERVGLIGENRPEWVIADLGIQAVGAATTGIYTTSSPEQTHYILEHAGCRVFVVECEEQLDKALETRGRLQQLEHIVVMDPEGLRKFRDHMVMMWDQFVTMGQDHARRHPSALDERMAEIRPDDMAVRQFSVFLPVRWGYTVNFIENVDTVMQNFAEVAPTLVFGVPRIWEKI